MRLIRVLRLIRGPGVHRIHHEARIHHANVTQAAEVSSGALGARLVAHRPYRTGLAAHAPHRSPPSFGALGPIGPGREDHANSAHIRPACRLVIEATVNL